MVLGSRTALGFTRQSASAIAQPQVSVEFKPANERGVPTTEGG